ncbi:GntR family transcriptional regulator [Roseivivax halodurans JCM 10272]|uniref:GntR family transcriptional regulator n=1 Tax=Roseivivax halodurans JCM 10272 TaxID=1449350 RepID=X7EIW0_9RHOB|nr:GntR family transcriptional regulator [Roseivivax halodurans JCM 10272]
MWTAIAETLRREIVEGSRQPGDRLPTEAQLSRRFGVNRHTVRRALSRLGEEGLVHSRRGAGAFVAARRTEYPLGARVRFHRNIRAGGRLPSRRIDHLEERPATAEEAEALELGPSGRIVLAEGVSFADGCPIALFASRFPAERLAGIAQALAEVASVTEALARVGVGDYARRSTRIGGELADPAQAAKLELSPGAPLVWTESLNVDPGGVPVEYGFTYFSGERVTLVLDHS